MSDLKCPFCKEEIISDVCCMFDKEDKDYTNGRQIYKCNKCGLFGNKTLWQELIETKQNIELLRTKNIDRVRSCGNCNDMLKELNRTKKALDVAVDGIKYMRNNCLEYAADYMDKADEILEQITALEQKDII